MDFSTLTFSVQDPSIKVGSQNRFGARYLTAGDSHNSHQDVRVFTSSEEEEEEEKESVCVCVCCLPVVTSRFCIKDTGPVLQ